MRGPCRLCHAQLPLARRRSLRPAPRRRRHPGGRRLGTAGRPGPYPGRVSSIIVRGLPVKRQVRPRASAAARWWPGLSARFPGCKRGARGLTGCPGHPRSCRHGLAGMTLAGRPVPCGQPLVPTGPQSRASGFSNHSVLAGAPLRNRTVDLLLTMHAGFVRLHRVGSDYRSPEGYWRLVTSHCVCHRLGPLSLGKSLVLGPDLVYL
jgi:hypothetical protein